MNKRAELYTEAMQMAIEMGFIPDILVLTLDLWEAVQDPNAAITSMKMDSIQLLAIPGHNTHLFCYSDSEKQFQWALQQQAKQEKQLETSYMLDRALEVLNE